METPSKLACPPDLQLAFLDMLTTTLITIRNNPTDARFCSALADHMHNVPALLADFHVEMLGFYWKIERPCFLAEMRRTNHDLHFDQPWQVIEREYQRLSG